MHPTTFEIPEVVNGDGWIDSELLSPNVILYRKIGEDEARYVDYMMRDTLCVAVVDVKGGVKKTTTAVHTAHGIHRLTGGTTMIGDCDQFHSAQDWYAQSHEVKEKTGEPDPWPEEVTVFSADGDNFHHEIIAAVQEQQPDYVVLDTPPNDTEAALRALLLADVVLMPTGPFELDLRRLSFGIKEAARAAALRGRPIEPMALVTGTKMGTNVYNAARKFLQTNGIPFANMPIRDLVAQAAAFGTSVKKLNDYGFVPDDLVPMLNKIVKAG